jgi:hypothetical protein
MSRRVQKLSDRDKNEDAAARWFRLRRRIVDELEELPATPKSTSSSAVRGGSSSVFARADGGAAADYRLAPSRGGAAPNKAGR